MGDNPAALRAQFDAMKRLYEDKLRAEGYSQAVAEIVAWLRTNQEICSDMVDAAADAIERGEFKRST